MGKTQTQRGAALITSLIFLTAMTLLGLASIGTSTTNLRIVGNLQSQRDAEAAAQEGLEQVLDSASPFTAPPATPFNQPISNNRTTVIETLVCRSSEPAQGYSATMTLVPEDNTWQVTSRYTSADGSSATVHQGVRLRQLAGSCP